MWMLSLLSDATQGGAERVRSLARGPSAWAGAGNRNREAVGVGKGETSWSTLPGPFSASAPSDHCTSLGLAQEGQRDTR